MCGIAGAFVIGPAERATRIVEAIVESQYQRGPDHQAVEVVTGRRSATVLGHNRLSIIDLSAEANQPMWDSSGRYGLIFNGEVYNYLELRSELMQLGHRFRTKSDSEVILEAFKEWGPEAVSRFNGMFAFGLYDKANERLWLFRDRFGVKPVYYSVQGGVCYFASTPAPMGPLLALSPNLEYLSRGLRYWVYEDDTDIAPYTGQRALPPGHFLTVECSDSGQLRCQPQAYYDLRSRVQELTDVLATKPVPALVDMITGCLDDAVALRLRADVPLGVSLSGGLDSSTVAALLAERHPQVQGFTFGHPAALTSEGPLVAELAAQAKLQVEYVWPGAQEIIDAFWDTLQAQGAPFPGGSIVAQHLVFRAARARGTKVMLGGQGGDELFMGYRKYQLFWLHQLAREKQFGKAVAFGASLIPMMIAELPQAKSYWSIRQRYTGAAGVDTTLRLPEPPPLSLNADAFQPPWVRQMYDVTRYSLPTLLRYEDRNSAGNSVESRLPFLDYRLVEMGLALPTAVKLRGGFGKWIVREVARGKIPESIRTARYKRGFDVNQTGWVHAGLGESIRTRLKERLGLVREWLAPGVTIDEAFSNVHLEQRRNTMAEAITLIWLADSLGGGC